MITPILPPRPPSDPPILVPANMREVELRFALTVAALCFACCIGGMACGAMVARAQPALEGDDASSRPEGQSAPDRSEGVVSLERALALAVAKVAVNEASLAHCRPADVALIWQTTEGHGGNAASRLAWLQRHSSCVTTARPIRPTERRTNCVWSRNLADSDARPAGWPDDLDWSGYVDRWRDVRRTALALVRHRSRVPYPCRQTPWTWGSVADSRTAHQRGLYRIECIGTANIGFVRGAR